jgi:predicted Zn-dependent peptidase
VDFDKALTIAQTNGKLPLLYVKNTTDELFNLTFRYEFGHEDDNRYDMVSDYLNVVGTKTRTATEVKQQFYNLACNYSVNVNGDNLNISLSGLSENMPAALNLLEDLLQNAQGDADSYNSFVEMIMKARENRKKDQRTCFDYLYEYALYGPHNMRRDDMTEQALRAANPQALLNLLSDLRHMEHSVLYYGPMSVQALSDLLAKAHPTPQQLKPVPQGQPYTRELTPKNEVWIAPYDAKNIYMRMYHNEDRAWNPAENGVQTLFNEYYGAGMNGIVFQEMREARGLAYNAGAAYLRPGRQGEKEYFYTHIISQNDKMMDCINQFHQILDTIPQSEAAFQIAKESVLKLMATSRVRKGGIISRYLMMKRLGLEKDLSEATYQAIQQLQLKDIVAFEAANMARKPFRYIILGDEKELDIPALEKIGPIKRLTLEEVFGY